MNKIPTSLVPRPMSHCFFPGTLPLSHSVQCSFCLPTACEIHVCTWSFNEGSSTSNESKPRITHTHSYTITTIIIIISLWFFFFKNDKFPPKYTPGIISHTADTRCYQTNHTHTCYTSQAFWQIPRASFFLSWKSMIPSLILFLRVSNLF